MAHQRFVVAVPWLILALSIGTARSKAQTIKEVLATPLTLDEAQRIIGSAQTAAAEMNVRVSIAVVDTRGDVIAVVRMTGAGAATPDVAIGKGMLSATFGRPSAAMTGMVNQPFMHTLNDASGGRFRFFQGALPIVKKDVVLGAAAASGGSAQQDEDIIRYALKTTFEP